MSEKNKKKIKTIGSKKGLHLTPIKITIVSLGALVLMLTIGIFNDENYFNFDKIKKNKIEKNDKIEINNNNNNNNNKKHCC